MVGPSEKEIRTENKGMLVCTVVKKDNGNYSLIKRNGKKEDTMSVSAFLSKVYERPVTIVID